MKEGFKKTYMELVYQMFRTTLYRFSKIEFQELGNRLLSFYNNEVMHKMYEYFLHRKNSKLLDVKNKRKIIKATLLKGDSEQTLLRIQSKTIHFIFTSPPYYNARMYSDYTSYERYLEKMCSILKQCNRVLEDGRFIIINVSPVITKRPGREFESVRYPIHFDFHKILEEAGFYFIDEIIWIKPEYTVPNRIAGYLQTGMPLSYKPNCVTESLLVYRKKTPFLLDENIKRYSRILANAVENTDTSNCWHISPKIDKDHPAVFPEKLCEKVLKYYSFSGDVVLDPFAGSGTFGRVAKKRKRIPVLCEMDNKYIKKLEEENYDNL
ncbi:methyltransferase [Endomicrobiia bacterium]|nr:methyltransferase [Endomicrobiia bacterium]GHT11280.1 methyltransferase [Endomicrobiia bacterium]GHT19563.1 methyltransferase [Endomicrobiia bacterium]GHT25636.1 methyltransferase [Endomicrobiia bacterium]GHT30526.1 methyltransferase [Endomicrobiia bacterium]